MVALKPLKRCNNICSIWTASWWGVKPIKIRAYWAILIKPYLIQPCPVVTPREAVEKMFPYIEQQLSQGVYLNHVVRHMLGAFQSCKGARQWRRYLSENAHKAGAGLEVVEKALSFVAS